ncbi:MAG TPA: hypothetical protein VL738_43250 [Dactylosporangium sp.]|nr:hypothetical protein [Dactylosporangium sp.]
MSTLTIELPHVGARMLEEMSIPATELAEGDILGGDTTREVSYAVAYEGADGPCVEYVLRPIGLTGASRPHYLAGDVEVAILRPTGGAS